mgnify:FL=1
MSLEKKRHINLNKNLVEKKKLIERLKNLINLDTKMNEKYLDFKEIQKKWFNIGPVSRKENSIIWNNFQHHIKNFYDYLHLNRKFKEIDIKHNEEQKGKIINQSKELIKSKDIIRSYKYYERLKKKWKYEIGPTKKDNDKILNKKFSEIGKKIYNNKIEFDKNKDIILNQNLLKKEAYLKEIIEIIDKVSNTPKEWQKKIKEFEKIKNSLDKIGPIHSNKKKIYWKNYKETIGNYYSSKNLYYKNLKKIYRENILKQKDLIEKAQNIQSNKNIEKSKKEIIIIQKEWKKINPVPYKINQKNYQKFKSTCNYFFNKIDETKANKLKESKKNRASQNKFLKEIEKDKSKKEIDINKLINKWKGLGQADSQTELKFEKTIIKALLSEGFNEKESKIKFLEVKSNTMNNVEKNKKMSGLIKELDNLKKELSTLENNLSFFNEKSKENKLLNKVHKDIQKNKEQINNITSEINILKN